MPRESNTFAAGAASGFLVRFLTQPLDVVKIRFQLQVEPIKREAVGSYYSGISQAFLRIVREEGVSALWKGHVPGQLLSVVFCSAEFGTFYSLKRLLSDKVSSIYTAPLDFGVGMVAGGSATILSTPLDVMRTRLVAQGNKRVYSSFTSGLQTLVKNEGVLALWRGLGPSMMLIVPQTSITFFVYERLKVLCEEVKKSLLLSGGLLNLIYYRFLFYHQPTLIHPTLVDHNATRYQLLPLLTGAISGIVAKSLVYPLDLAKKRLELRGFESAWLAFGTPPQAYTSLSYRGGTNWSRLQLLATLHCLQGIVRHEGASALFKGWTPSMVKAASSTGLTFFFYDQLLILLS